MAGPLPITQLLMEWSGGNRAALDELIPHVYRELHVLAVARVRLRRRDATIQPTELIHELYLRLSGATPSVEWENRAHFFRLAARVMRMVLVDHARARHAGKRGGAAGALTLEAGMAFSPNRLPTILEIDEALLRLSQVDQRKAGMIEMRYFGGMTRDEIASASGWSVGTVKRDLRLGEAWLRRCLTVDG